MRKLALTALCFVLLLFSAYSTAQEVKHAPTVEQCSADVKLWSAEAGMMAGQKIDFDSEPVETVEARGEEMTKCSVIDQSEEFNRGYEQFSDAADLVVKERMWNFLERHGLYQKFLAEDREGKR
jgi:hypothetical protein